MAKRLIFLTNGNPTRMTLLSGTPYHMLQALKAELGAVEALQDYKPALLRKLQWWISRWSKGRIDLDYLPRLNRWLAARVARRFGGGDTLFIAALCAPFAAELARLAPVLYLSDTTFDAVRGAYPVFSRLSPRFAALAERGEHDVIRRARLCSFSSEWAARSAIEAYGADPGRVSNTSWGCNMDWVEPTPAAVVPADECRLLFIGVDWQRKGGDVVLETCALLAARGFRFTADLVGSRPAAAIPTPPGVTLHGRLDKSDPAQAARLGGLLRDAGFLFLPTRQDCTPMVFAEAMALGVPAITRDIGGVSSVVENGVTGTVLAPDATALDFADAIVATWSDRAAYAAMRHAARASYEGRLNWRVWAQVLRREIEAIELSPPDHGASAAAGTAGRRRTATLATHA